MEQVPIRSDAELAALTLPVQLILGCNDILIRSGETRERMERLVVNLRLTFLENVGHILPPQTRTIAEFLETVTSPIGGQELVGMAGFEPRRLDALSPDSLTFAAVRKPRAFDVHIDVILDADADGSIQIEL